MVACNRFDGSELLYSKVSQTFLVMNLRVLLFQLAEHICGYSFVKSRKILFL